MATNDRERRLNYHVHDAITYLENAKYPDSDRVVLALATLRRALEVPGGPAFAPCPSRIAGCLGGATCGHAAE